MRESLKVDVLVIGAAQAGLAAGYHLRRAGIGFLIVDRATRIGDSWRNRYESLTLFTPRAFSALPGLAPDGDPDGYPSRIEFADYLEAYAREYSLPVKTGAEVVGLERHAGGFRAALADGTAVECRSVIVATGGFQSPLRPALSAGFGPSVLQLDTETYRNPANVPGRKVLVVGDGASGRDVAAELAPERETFLSVGKPRKLFPERILGKSVWWWLKALGLMRARPDSALGRIMRRADPFPNRGRDLPGLRKRGVRILPRLVGAEGGFATFADGARIEVDGVVWAVGYRDETDWLRIPEAKDFTGRLLQAEGVSPVPGLFFLGRPWQRNRASALVMGAGDDANVIVDRIVAVRKA